MRTALLWPIDEVVLVCVENSATRHDRVSHPLQSIACHEAAWQEKESKEMDEKQTTHEIVAPRKGWLADGGSRRDFLKLGAMGVTGLASSAALAAPSSRSNGLESGSEEKRMAYQLQGRMIEVCSCEAVCPCFVNETPDGGACDVTVAWHIDNGEVEGVDVSGRTTRG